MTLFPDGETLLKIGGIEIKWYAILILSGAFIAYFISQRYLKKMGYDRKVGENFFFYMMPIAIIGTRLWFVIFNPVQYIADPISIFQTWKGGLAFHGGVIFAIVFAYFYLKSKNINLLRFGDAVLPTVMIAQAIGRWGNFLNKEAYGGIVSEAFYNGWPAFVKNQMFIQGQYRVPTFLLEGIGNIVGYIIIVFLFKKFGRKKRGDLMYAYFIWYGMIRFFVEGMRTDSLYIGSLRIAQVISILGMVIGFLGLFGVYDKLFKNIYPFKKEKPIIIFDADGTLIDTKSLIEASYIHTFNHYKPDHELTKEEMNSFMGPTLKEVFVRYFDADMGDELIEYYREFNLREHDNYVTPFDGVKETLETLKQEGYSLAVVSNKQASTVKMGLKVCDIKDYFDVVIGCDDIDEPKPSPIGIVKACELSYHNIDDVIYVGDQVGDIKAAKNMSAYSIAILYDNAKEESIKAEKPCKIIYNMNELLPLLKEDIEWSDNTI